MPPARESAMHVTDRHSLPGAPSGSQGRSRRCARYHRRCAQSFFPIALRARAYQPPVARRPPLPQPPPAPGVRPGRRAPQRPQSLRPVTETYGSPRIFRLHCSHRMPAMLSSAAQRHHHRCVALRVRGDLRLQGEDLGDQLPGEHLGRPA